MDETVSLLIPFIAIIFFIGMTENLIQAFQRISKKFGNEILAFVIVFILGTLISFSGDFRFFSYLGVNFNPVWISYMMTGLVIAAGSPFLERKFDVINKIPMIIAGIRFSRPNNTDNPNEIYDPYNPYDSDEPTI